MEYEVQPSRLPGIIDVFESWIAAENLHTVTVQYLGTGQNAPESAADGEPYTADDVRAMASGQELLDSIVDDFHKPGKKLQARATFLGEDGKPDRQGTQRKRVPMRKARPSSVTAGSGGGGDAIKHLATAVTNASNTAVERSDKLADSRDGMAEKMMTLGQQHGEQRLADLLPLLGFAQKQQLDAQQARHDATIAIWEAQQSSEQTSWADVACFMTPPCRAVTAATAKSCTSGSRASATWRSKNSTAQGSTSAGESLIGETSCRISRSSRSAFTIPPPKCFTTRRTLCGKFATARGKTTRAPTSSTSIP